MARKKSGKESLTIVDIYRLQGRVGRSPIERLEWVVDFAQRDLQDLTPGDWLNLSQELWAFSVTRVLWDGPYPFPLNNASLFYASIYFGRIKPTLPTRAKAKGYQKDMRDVLDRLDRTNKASYGPIKKTLQATLYQRRAETNAYIRVFYALFGAARDLREGQNLIERFFDLLAEARGFLDRCADEKCGRWFVSGRFEQKFCSNKCQNRVKSRRTMAAKRKAAKAKKKRSARRKK